MGSSRFSFIQTTHDINRLIFNFLKPPEKKQDA